MFNKKEERKDRVIPEIDGFGRDEFGFEMGEEDDESAASMAVVRRLMNRFFVCGWGGERCLWEMRASEEEMTAMEADDVRRDRVWLITMLFIQSLKLHF